MNASGGREFAAKPDASEESVAPANDGDSGETAEARRRETARNANARDPR